MMQLASNCRKSGGADKQACGSFGICFGDYTHYLGVADQ